MLSLKSDSASEDLNSLLTYSTVSATEELKIWARLNFDDMDRESGSSTNSHNRTRTDENSSNSGSNSARVHTHTEDNVEDVALLAQFAATVGNLGQDYSDIVSHNNSYPPMGPTPGFYGNFMHHGAMSPAQLPPISALDFPWQAMLPLQGQNHDPLHAHASSSTTQPFQETAMGSVQQQNRGDGRRGRQLSVSDGQMRTSTSPEVEQTEVDGLAISEEKRRRNTAASARFRIKKKHKTLTLERSVTELTGRAEELEREAADLRRENGWLKEIVMLKGTRFAANNLAARQAAADMKSQEAGSSANAASREEEQPSEQESELSAEETLEQKKEKGKKPHKTK